MLRAHYLFNERTFFQQSFLAVGFSGFIGEPWYVAWIALASGGGHYK